jgi:hypothetical protein
MQRVLGFLAVYSRLMIFKIMVIRTEKTKGGKSIEVDSICSDDYREYETYDISIRQ